MLNARTTRPGNPGSVLPGGFAVANNKLYILGGFNINVASTDGIWEFDPNAAEGSRWTEKVNAPVGIMFRAYLHHKWHHLRGGRLRFPEVVGGGHDQLVQFRPCG